MGHTIVPYFHIDIVVFLKKSDVSRTSFTCILIRLYNETIFISLHPPMLNILEYIPMYLFDLNPGPDFKYASTAIIFFLLVLAVSIGLLIYTRSQTLNKTTKKCLVPMVTHIFWFSIAGMLLVIFRLNGIPLLSMRVFFALWVIAFITYLVGRRKSCRAVEITPAQTKKADPYLALSKKKKKK